MTVLVLNGPNLNLLGTREPATYGSTTLADVERMCAERGRELGYTIDFRQSNHEGVLIDAIHEAGRALLAGPLGHLHHAGVRQDRSRVLHDPHSKLPRY